MTYKETLDFLYAQLPVFESQGAHAYKPGLERVEAMDEVLGHPHTKYRTIHVACTNGKGSTSHLLAAILQSAGYKVGLFTSPHLVDFSERIRVNGEEIDHQYVVDWTERWVPREGEVERFEKFERFERFESTPETAETPQTPQTPQTLQTPQTPQTLQTLLSFQPSFFELANMMAFCYFADQEVDVAVIEVGLGGRLDSTNIITPALSVITNISLDHTQFLGDTLPQIAAEKAGIMKPGVTCVIGECTDERVHFTFEQNAQLHEVKKLRFADERRQVMWVKEMIELKNEKMKEWLADEAGKSNSASSYGNLYVTLDDGELWCPLTGACQPHNANTVITAVQELREEGFVISQEALEQGFRDVIRLTHLRGRWETLATYPDGSTRVLCDTGHNEGCFQYIGPQLQSLIEQGHPLHIVFGMVSDKDVDTVLGLLPLESLRVREFESLRVRELPSITYYFCNAPTPRALPAAELARMAQSHGLKGEVYASIDEALDAALSHTSHVDDVPSDQRPIVFVGGSNFIVCEAMRREL